ncbi:MAG: hypothetical protein ACYC9L_05580 [Sulfuricaulis sp.]
MVISVVIPTIPGREHLLAKTEASYRAENTQLIVVKGRPTCGEAWVEGASRAEGDYLHFSADDIEAHPGWWGKAAVLSELGFLPAPRILNTDGSLQSCGDWDVEMRDGAIPEFTRVPFLSKEQWAAIDPLVTPFLEKAHYYTDNIVSWAGRKLGMETVVCRSYELTHHLAGQGRLDRMRQDFELFMNYITGAG